MSTFITPKGRPKKLPKIWEYAIKWHGGSRSKFQKKVKECLIPLWNGHIVYEEFPVVGTRSTIDFYNSTIKVAIEVQGNQHTKYIPFFHGKTKIKFLDQLRRDREKEDFCEKNDIKLVELFEDDIITTEFLKQKIYGD